MELEKNRTHFSSFPYGNPYRISLDDLVKDTVTGKIWDCFTEGPLGFPDTESSPPSPFQAPPLL